MVFRLPQQAVSAFSGPVWDCAWGGGPVLARFARRRPAIDGRARELLASKHWLAMPGARFGAARQVRTALLMALPLAGLDVSWYRGFASVLVYPTVFRARQEVADDAGVVHEWAEWRAGETSARGPLVLALPEVAASGRGSGYNVVIHECAHQLDFLGSGEGMPPLHPDMRRSAWTEAFVAAYDDVCERAAAGRATAVDAYGAQSPGEFFAVTCEAFFETPRALRRAYPRVYAQLAAFFRIDPLRV